MADFSRTFTDILAVQDGLARRGDFARKFAELLGLAEVFQRLGEYLHNVEDCLVLAKSVQARMPALVSGVPPCPYTWALAPNGYVYFANGLYPLQKWDGVNFEASQAGVPAPKSALTINAGGSGEISGNYTAYQRWLDADGNPSSLSPVSNTAIATNAGIIVYSSVEAPTDGRVTRRQILRNTAGQTTVYYVDVDTRDLQSTTFTSTMSDSNLSTREKITLPVDGVRFGLPPNNKAIVVNYLGRLFLAGDVSYEEGHAEVTNNTKVVVGVGTQWKRAFAGRRLYVTGHEKSYLIKSVDETNQTLNLEESYSGPTDRFAVYSIQSAPGDRNLIYYSETDFLDGWNPSSTIGIEQNEDEITALAPADSFLFIVMRRHIYRLTYNQDPGTDGGVFLSCLRGCVNQRCWLRVDENLYLLDEQGIYRFAGSQVAEPISGPIQDLFWMDGSRDGDQAMRINWKASKFFHAIHGRDEQVLRWFVAIGGDRLPRHALCYHYRMQTWWIEEYPYPVGASAIWSGVSSKYLLSGPSRRVLSQARGLLDGPAHGSGTTRGKVSGATLDSITDVYANYPQSGLVGNPVCIVDGRGKGQRRIITEVSGRTLRVLTPWKVIPDQTSTYQIGGVPWRWKSGWLEWADEEMTNPRRVALLFEPCGTENIMDLYIYEDHSRTPSSWSLDYPSSKADRESVHVKKGKADAPIDLTDREGFAQLRMDDGSEIYVHGPNLVAVELRGFSAESPTRIYEVVVEGASQ